jgi:capsular polysaccharide biosynthesis protein
MQLRELSAIVRRYWIVILLLPLLAGGLSMIVALRQPQRYQAAARLMVSQTPFDAGGVAALPDYNNSYSWLASEYILDDLPQVLNSLAFAEDVAQTLSAEGYTVGPEAVRGSLRAEVLHRSVLIVGSAATPEQALAIVRGAIATLQANGLKYWGRAPLDGPGLQVALLDPATPGGPTSTTRALLFDVGLRTALALAAGIALALLLHYLDDRLRSREQAEQWTGARVLAVIPKE